MARQLTPRYDPVVPGIAPSSPSPRRAAEALNVWRPMPFGRRGGSHIRDPIVEPLWGGMRVLISIDGDDVVISNTDGDAVEGWEALRVALLDAALSAELVVDGYVTTEVLRETTGIGFGPAEDVLDRTPGIARRLFTTNRRPIGRRGEHEAALRRLIDLPLEGPVAFVAIDLLWVEDVPLIDVPLQERKRLLESALGERALVRRTSHVRPPLQGWYNQWRAFGFNEVAVKSANSRYTPGEPNEAWGTALIPKG
jgi:ATP dependent DNA ligase domain